MNINFNQLQSTDMTDIISIAFNIRCPEQAVQWVICQAIMGEYGMIPDVIANIIMSNSAEDPDDEKEFAFVLNQYAMLSGKYIEVKNISKNKYPKYTYRIVDVSKLINVGGQKDLALVTV